MPTMNPYTTREPYMWAGDYLLFRGKVVGYIEYEGEVSTAHDPWRGLFLIDNKGSLRPDAGPFARSTTRAGAMLRLQEWLEDMIGRNRVALDIFTMTADELNHAHKPQARSP